MKIIVSLVSDQPIPNLIPLKVDELKPDKVVLLVSNKMQQKSNLLKNVMEKWKFPVEVISSDAYNLESAKTTCLSIVEKYPDAEVILNATGGTKVMAFAAYDTFNSLKKDIFYIDTQDKEIKSITANHSIKYDHWLDVESYLNAYGQTIASHSNTFFDKYMPILRNLFQKLVDPNATYLLSIPKFNFYCSKAAYQNRFPFSVDIDDKDFRDRNFMSLVNLFTEFHLLEKRGNAIVFPSSDHLTFLHGGWLEAFVYDEVKKIPGTDVYCNAKIQMLLEESNITKNEYDVVFTYYNRLYLIECKAASMNENDKTDNIIYKLNTLKDFSGGLYGRGLLVSLRKLSDWHKKRMKDYRLECVEEVQGLYHLSKALQKLIQ